MISLTTSQRTLFQQWNPQIVEITMDTTAESLTITESDLVTGTFEIDRYSMSGNRIEFGAVYASELSFTLDNRDGRFNDVTFEGAELLVKIGCVNPATNARTLVRVGYFTIDEVPRKLDTIKIYALDRMVQFDKPVPSDTVFPSTWTGIVQKCATDCDMAGGLNANVNLIVPLNNAMSQNGFDCVVPVDKDWTYRKVLRWCCEVMGVCAYFNEYGNLAFQWYTANSSSETIDKTVRFTSDLYENDVVVTGILCSGDSDTEVLVGTDEYPLCIADNKSLEENSDYLASLYSARLNGFSYRPYEATIKPMFWLFPLDKITFVDKNGNSHSTIITHCTYRLNGKMSISAKGESAEKAGYATMNPLTARESRMLKQIREEAMNSGSDVDVEAIVSEKELEILSFTKAMASACGLYSTKVEDTTGASKYYLHNDTTLQGSTKIYALTDQGFGVATSWNDGEPVFSIGISSSGNAILDTIVANKITTDMLATGCITNNKLSSSLRISADKLDLSALTITIGTTSGGGSTAEVGTYESASTTYGFDRTSDGYYTSNNAGVDNSLAFGIMRFNFTTATTVTFECISYGENNYDFGIVSVVDSFLTYNNELDSSGVAKSFNGLSSPSMQSFTLNIPSGNHYVTFKYIKDTSQASGGDYFKIRCKATVAGQQLPNSITLKNGTTTLSSANINLSGLVTFSDLSGQGRTQIHGSNIITDTLSVKSITFNNPLYNNVNTISSELISGTNAVVRVGLINELVSNMMQVTEIYGSRIYMIASGYDNSSSRSLVVDCVNQVIYPHGNGVWEIGSYDYPFNAIYTDDIYFRDGLSRLYMSSSGTLKFYCENDGRTYNVMLD